MLKNINKIVKGDRVIIIIVIVLMLFSSLLMGSTLTKMALDRTVFSFAYLIRQILFTLIAFTMMVLLSQIPYQVYYKLSKTILLIAAVLTIMTIVFGDKSNDAKRWLMIPILKIKFQPSDFVKFALITYTANIISGFKFDKGKNELDLLKRILIPTLSVVLLTAPNDFSTAGIMYITIFSIIFVSPIDKKLFWKVFGIITIAGAMLFFISIKADIFRGSTWENRLTGKTDGYNQKLEAKIAVANGGLLFKPGKSRQKHVLENSYSDFIFAITAEEYGIFGVAIIISLYLIFAFRVLLIVKRQKRSFPTFLIIGITNGIIIQAFTHILINLGIGPVTGLPLPLVSHGGTSIIMTAAQIGIILNISQIETKKTPATAKEESNIDINEAIHSDVLPENSTEKDKEQEIEINDYPFLYN